MLSRVSVVMCFWESEKQKLGFIKQVDLEISPAPERKADVLALNLL